MVNYSLDGKQSSVDTLCACLRVSVCLCVLLFLILTACPSVASQPSRSAVWPVAAERERRTQNAKCREPEGALGGEVRSGVRAAGGQSWHFQDVTSGGRQSQSDSLETAAAAAAAAAATITTAGLQAQNGRRLRRLQRCVQRRWRQTGHRHLKKENDKRQTTNNPSWKAILCFCFFCNACHFVKLRTLIRGVPRPRAASGSTDSDIHIVRAITWWLLLYKKRNDQSFYYYF